jgi:hypothetical protein
MRCLYSTLVLAACLLNSGLSQETQKPNINYAAIAAAEAAANRGADEAASKREADDKRSRAESASRVSDPVETHKYLLKEREIEEHRLQVAEKILAARSYAAKSEIFCRDRVGNPASLMMAFSNGLSGDEMKALYAKLLRAEPATREGELDRQRKLEVAESIVSNYERNVSTCKAAVVNGDAKMPSDAEETQEIKQSKTQIAEIDRLLAGSQNRR